MNLLKKLWAEEPVIVRVGLATAVAAGVLTASDASALGAAVAGLVEVVGAITSRAGVRPTRRH